MNILGLTPFRAIFTSNPDEYCGVHATQDALLDRLITINIPEPDELTQQEIAVQKSGIDRDSALLIVRLVKAFHSRTGNEKAVGLRSTLMLSRICQQHEILVMPENAEFREVCQDILLARSGLLLEDATHVLWDILEEMIYAAVIQSHAVAEDDASLDVSSKPVSNSLSRTESHSFLPQPRVSPISNMAKPETGSVVNLVN